MNEVYIIRYNYSNSSYSYNTTKGFKRGFNFHKKWTDRRNKGTIHIALISFEIYYSDINTPLKKISQYP